MRTYSPELKAQVIAEVSTGGQVKPLSRKYKVPEATVRYWRDTARAQPVLAPQKREDLGALVYEYIATGLQALIAQAREIAAPEYIKAQPADALYLLHGTLADKLIALFGAIERGQPVDAEPEEEGATVAGGLRPGGKSWMVENGATPGAAE